MRLEKVLKLTQNQLAGKIKATYGNKAIMQKGKYILVPGVAPVLLVAHLDTVHKQQATTICKSARGNILMSPQGIGGDDRCGVYALMEVYRRSVVKPWLLFTYDEEIGCVGAAVFARDADCGELPPELFELKCIVEIDRKGSNDAVYYECDNDEFELFISGYGFETEYGSMSDISEIAPALGVAAVNLSSGYYNAHTLHEYINKADLTYTIERVIDIVSDVQFPDVPHFKYVERKVVLPQRHESNIYSFNPALVKDQKWPDESDLTDWYMDDPDDIGDMTNSFGMPMPADIWEKYQDLIMYGYDAEDIDGMVLDSGYDFIYELWKDTVNCFEEEMI